MTEDYVGYEGMTVHVTWMDAFKHECSRDDLAEVKMVVKETVGVLDLTLIEKGLLLLIQEVTTGLLKEECVEFTAVPAKWVLTVTVKS